MRLALPGKSHNLLHRDAESVRNKRQNNYVNKIVSLAASTALTLTPTLTMAQQLPTGGSVAAGNATISSPNGSTLNVNQTTDRAVINWSGFSVGQGATVNFNQPGVSSATLNRVTGSTPSSIAGTINAPGTVLLVNPNGIAITKSGVVNVGSFAASTLDIKDSDFMSGKYSFSGNGSSAGVTNAGRINVSDGGFAALLGGQVANDGVISARLGKVGLGSGELITLDLSGDGFLSVAVPTNSLGGIVGSDGHPLVSNKGKIVADGGAVYLSAATAANLLRDAVYVPGTIRANSVGTRDGKIVIGGGAGGKVTVTGKVKASGGKIAKGGKIDISGAQVAVSGTVKANGTEGGTVKVTGTEKVDIAGTVAAKGSTGKGGVVIVTANDVTLAATAKLDASGSTGGLLLIGGDYQGGANAANNFSIETIDNALTTTIATGATLNAAGTNGNGGKIIVWSDDKTTFAGALSVASTNGSGGFAEVSGHRLLDFTGTANLAGTAGAGTLLLDPRNVTISNGTDFNHDSSFVANGDNSVINVTTLQNALASGNVIVTTGGAGSAGSQAGDITVASDVTWSANTLTLQAYHSINVNATMSATGTAGLTLTTNNGGTGGTLSFAGKVTFANASQSLVINGVSYTLIDSMSALQNINNNLSGNYALMNSLDASAVSNWVPLGTDGTRSNLGTNLNGGVGFNGTFTGLGNAVSNLTVNLAGISNVGLFGMSNGGTISAVKLLNASFSGGSGIGGIVGYGSNLNIADIYVSGSMTGSGSYVGGIVGGTGINGGSITDAHADVAVSAQMSAGGIAGYFAGGPIALSSVTGSVHASTQFAGGLAGQLSNSAVSDSYSIASVSADQARAGGLVGSATTITIATSWSSGPVSSPSNAGGLVGSGTATFTNAYWDTQTSGQTYATGTAAVAGATGLNTSQAATQASYSGFDFTNTWYMVANSTRPFLRSEYSTTISNAHQLQLINMNATTLSASYKIVNDINLGAALSNASDMWGSKGWVPLGTDGAGNVLNSSGFNGSLDGQYHFIDGLTITRATNYNGLVGYSGSGSISKLGLTNVNITGGDKTGGLVGQLFSGSISDSFATGSVAGGWQVGGLIGQTDTNTSVLRTYFNGKVAGSGGATGGLVGQSAGSISQSYAAASVTGSSTNGLGGGEGTVTNSYYDNLMYGGTSGLGTGYVTAQMQSALSGFDSNWGVVSGASYFYLKGFYPTAPQVVSGTAYSDNGLTAAAGKSVSALLNGTAIGSAYAGANGYYNILLAAGTIGSNSQLVTYTTGTNAGVSYKQNVSGSTSGLNIFGNTLTETSAASTLSSVSSGLATAIGSSGVSTALANRSIIATGSSFTIDQAISVTGLLNLSSGGTMTQSSGASIAAASLKLQYIAGSASYTLTDSGNVFASLQPGLLGSGSLDLYSSSNLSVGSFTANGGLIIRSGGSLTLTGNLASSAAGDAVVLSAGTTFTNSASSSAISTPNGRWLVYAGTPTGSSFNNLNSNNAAIWNSTYANNAPSTIASGNRYVFAYQPTLTFTSTNASKYYGQTADVSASYTVTSNVSTVSGAYTVAAPSTFYTGAPTLSSAGTATTATVAGGPYAINIAQGSVVASGGYALAFANTGTLTVNKATLIIYAGSPNKTYGDTYSSTSNYSASGLYNGDTVSSVTLTSAGAAATANVGNYALTASNAQGTGLSNYNILYSDGTLRVGQAVLTITAASTSKQYGLTKTFAGSEFTSSGVVNGDTIGSVMLTSAGAAGTANVGSYQINASGATGAAMSNYMIYYNTGSLSVTPAPLTITSSDQAKTYGTAYNLGTTAFSITSGTLFNGNTLTGVTLTSGAAAATAAVGWQSIIPSAATGSGLSNYNVTYSAAGKLTVNPALLTITANDQIKTYGVVLGSNGQYAITSGTLFNGDTLTGVTLSSAGFAGSASVASGPYAITASNATGTGLYNYTITYVPGTLTVDRAPLTITAGGQSKLYGDTLTLDPTKFTYGQLYNGDTVSSVTLASDGSAATAAVGAHAITASNAQGTGLGNYNITYVDGALTVNKASLIIYVGAAYKGYGDTYTGSASDYSISGLKNSDSVSSVTLSSAGAAATANAGSYTLSGSNAQGTGLSNYNVLYSDGSLTVSKAILTINTANGTKTYGTNLNFSGTEFTVSGLKNSDAISSVSLSSSGAAGTANVGSYQIAASNATGSGLSNYLIYYNTGSLSVTPAPITITANDQAKTYGSTYNLGTTAFSITSGALLNSDTITGVTLTSGAAAATAAAGWQTIYASNATGTGLSNYAITYSTTGKLTVNPASLTITANDQTKTYGTVLGSNGQYAITNGTLFNGDTLTGVTLASAGFAASATVAGGPYAITASNATGNGLYNYTITYVPGVLTVNKASLVVTAADQSKIYGNTASLGTTGYTVTGNLYNGDNVNGVTLTSAGADASATVAGGPYAITASNAQGTGLGNYDIHYVDGALTVDKASLIVYAGSAGKTYGTTYSFGNLYTASGLKNADSISSVDLASAGASATANVGNYAVTASNAQGSGLGNYNISYQPGSLNVGPAILTVNANNGTKVYGSTGSFSGTEFTATGLVNGDSISSVQLASTGTAATANAGNYWITASNAAGIGLSNYLIYYNQGSLSVTQAPLTVIAGNQSKIYGSAANLGTTAFTTSGTLYNGDTVTSMTLASAGAAGTANVGGYGINAGNATGTGVSNYNITYVPGTLTVTPASLTITAGNQSKTYGDTLNLGSTAYTVTGPLYNGDTVTGVTLASGGTGATASVSAGSYAIMAGNAQGSGLSNYTITYVSGSLTVTKANLTVIASDASKGYGQTLVFNGTEFTSSGLKNGETIGSVTLTSAGATATADVNGSPYAIVASAASGGTFNAGNYNITYVNGALTVSPAALSVTVTPNAASKVYGDTLNFAGTEFTQAGLVNGDTISHVTLTSAGAAATATVGQYDIASSNAVFSSGSALNYNITYNVLANGLTVTPRSLVITATSASRVYGDANPTTGTATGNNLVNGDTITGVTLSSSATAASGVGSYSLTGSNATGTGLSNYAITYATVANGLTVTPRALVIAANNVSRIYGDANPATGTATGNNLVNGDAITGVTLSSPATTASGVGSYDLTGSNATGTGLSNYAITYATVANGLTVTPRVLVITANGVSRIYGDVNPTTGTATGNNLVNGDTITGVTLSSSATTASGVGGYDLTGSNATGSGLSNYAISYATVANGLTVTPRALMITANGVSRTYGDANPASGAATGNNLVNGDTITGVTLNTPATVASGVGGYDLTGSAATGTGLSNYAITYATVANGLTITPRTLVITANGVSRAYGEANPATGSATGDNLVNGDTIATVALSSPATAASNVGTYALTGANAVFGSGSASNYAISYATVPNGLTVTAATVTLTITPNAAFKTYGDALNFAGTEFTRTGLVNGDTISGVTLTSAGAAATAGVGQYDIASSNAVFSSGSASNYNIVYNVLANGLTVTPRALVITANNVSRTYGDANPTTSTATGNNLVNGDTITGVTLSSAATAASSVGSYDLTGSNAVGTGLGNYTITYATVANGLTVTPRSLMITANGVSRVYGDANPTTGTATGNNLVNGDTITGVTLNTPATTASGVGSYDLTGASATGTGLGNYTITYATAVNGLTVTPRALVISANGVSRVYGDANPTTGAATGNNLVNGDTITGVTLSSTATAASGVGSYDLTGLNATGTGLSNYAITYATVANGLTVTPRSLVISADGVSRVYGDANPTTGTATGSNLVNGDTVMGVTLSSPATTASGVGSYDLIGSAATGTGLSNYAITYATVASGLTVTPRALVITANSVSRTYGDANPTTGTATGNNLVNGDAITGVNLSSPATTTSGVGGYDLTGSIATGTGLSNYAISYATAANGLTVTPRSLVISADGVSRVYGDANPTTGTATGNNLVNGDTITGVTLSSSATASSGVGSYDLIGSNATGAGLSNYAITYATTANGLTVTPRSLVISANNVSRTYGDANPTTGTATGNNLVNGDTITGVTLSSSATAASGVGSYSLGGSNATGTGLSNYTITYATVANGLTVTPRVLAVTADAQSKTVGDADPLLTYRITTGSLVGSDTLTGGLTRVVGEGAGLYAILQGSLAASPNYSLAYLGANLTIVAPAATPTPTANGDYFTSRYVASTGANTAPIVNISYQPSAGNIPVISVVTAPRVSANSPTGSNVATATPAADPAQNIAPSGGPLALFVPISQFDKGQYVSDALPGYAAEAGQAAVLTMVARAGTNNRTEPKINALWGNGGASWTNVNEAVAKTAQFSDGNGTERKPAGDNGFTFVNGTTDIAAMLKSGPVMLGGTKPADAALGTPWLLALQLTADGKGIIANDPVSGRQVILAYDAATKTVGGVTGMIDPATRQVAPLGDAAPADNASVNIPAAAWSELKAFKPASYLAVTL